MPLITTTGIRCILVRAFTISGLGLALSIGCNIVVKLLCKCVVFVLHNHEHC
jgi:hypothetical protein